MIKELSFKNYSSFKEGATISFKINGKVPDSYYRAKNLSTIMGIKGANGSGKTNILKAFSFLSDFLTKSADKDVNDMIAVNSHFQNGLPSEFYIEFVSSDGTEYMYELSVNNREVLKESIHRRKPTQKTEVIVRIGNKIHRCISELDELKKVKLKSNASLVSIFRKFNFSADMEDFEQIWGFFKRVVSNVKYTGMSGLIDQYMGSNEVSEAYYEDKELFCFVKKILIESDTGIKDIDIKKGENDVGETKYYAWFRHEYFGGEQELPLVDESNGTKRLYHMMYLYWIVLQVGGILVVDEFDTHLHSMILPKVLELFENKKTNPYNAQFIFTAHNTEIINYLGKYRAILVNKENNESYCYRVDELPSNLVKNDRDLSKLYFSKKIGGTPEIDNDFSEININFGDQKELF